MNYGRLARDWRTWLVVVALLLSVVALAPTGESDGVTSLDFGLDLEGGTTLDLEPVGTIAEVEGLNEDEVNDLESRLADELDVRISVRAEEDSEGEIVGEVEARDEIEQENFSDALEDEGLTVNSVESGVSQETLNNLRDSVQLRLDNTLGSGAGAEVAVQSNVLTGEDYVVVEVPGEREEEGRIADIIRQEGRFEIHVLTDEDNNETELITRGDGVERGSVSTPIEDTERDDDTYYVQFRLTEDGADAFSEAMVDSGATQTPEDHPPVMYFDGEEVFRGALNPELASTIDEGTWDGGGLRVTGLENEEAQEVSVALRSGELPAPVRIASSTVISPLRGEQFKEYSLLIAFFAVLAVGATIYNRYRDLRIAVPTMLTGVAEVFILLGFSAAFNFNIDLSYIAGLIAVVGTGVDDLIIIADEVQERGEIGSSEVYRKRLKRAFIVIGMAATTTIGAMLPLLYVGLGRISGFATVTIVGVLVGVLITRPAYGSLLRELLTEK
ncbi:MAG: hypothetical protein ACLFMT_02420 [Halobacteriales archaeon]